MHKNSSVTVMAVCKANGHSVNGPFDERTDSHGWITRRVRKADPDYTFLPISMYNSLFVQCLVEGMKALYIEGQIREISIQGEGDSTACLQLSTN